MFRTTHSLSPLSMLPTSRRTLVQALIVSLLIHAVLLIRGVSVFPARLDVPAATISVVMRGDIQGDASKSVSTPAAKPPAEPVKESAPVVRNTVAGQLVVPEPSAVAAPTVQLEARDAGQHVPMASGTAAGGGAASSAARTAPAREGASADDLRQYHLSLITAARRLSFKRYPVLARERGWEGTVEVSVRVGPQLPKPEVALVRSSGRSVLDAQALEVMTQAAAITVLPAGLKGRDFRDLILWEFSLKNDQ